MESGERMASPSSAPSSLHMASSSASSSPAPPQTPSTKYKILCSPGHLLQMTGNECLNTSGSSSGFPLLSHPAFGVYTSTSGRSEFGGLGSLGLSALAAHPQFGTFPDWWRPSEAHTRGAAAFFPPLLGLHPVFASTFKNCDPAHLQSRTSGYKRPQETSSMSGSQSGSLSDSSSDGEESSSDPDDMEDEEEEDNDEDEDDQSNDSEDSDSESQVKWKVKVRQGYVEVLLCVFKYSPLHSKDSFKQTFSLQPLSQNWYKSYKNSASSSPLLIPPKYSNDTNLFLNHRPNGAIHSEVQDAPLALITKPRSQSSTPNSKRLLAATSPSYPMPINLSTGTKEPSGSSASPLKSSASSGLAHGARKTKTSKSLHAGKSLPKTNPSCLPVDLVRGSESDIHSSKDSDSDSLGDDFDDEDDDDDEEMMMMMMMKTMKMILRMKILVVACQVRLNRPLFNKEMWQRETRIRTVAGRLQGEVAYFAPCGKKLRQYPDVMKYLLRNGITEISRDNFSFSTKIKVGDFYEAREGPERQQFLNSHNIMPPLDMLHIEQGLLLLLLRSVKGILHSSHGYKNCKIARQAAQIKLMRKLEKQAMAQAAKEAKKQQAIMAAEERRKKREQMKILKQQEKIKRIQQIRMEKELRAQQILEAKRKKKEEAANARILEAEKRNKVSKMRFMSNLERRRQHMMLMKAVETRKKAEEKERLKKEKKDEKRLNKERKLELRRLELEKAKELKKPNEDMCLADHKRLPELSRIPGLVLPGSTFSDCLMVLQFLRSFGKVLGLDMNLNILNLSDLQEGLLNIGDSMGKVQDLLVSMVSAAVCDPGIPAGHKIKTSLGDHLTNVEINQDNVSEILQIYMEGHCEQTELTALALSLRTKAFQAHSPSQKASMLAFLVNELCCSKAVTSEIDKNIDHMTYLRKDKWVVEGKLRKLRSIHAKRTGKRDSSVGGEDSHTCVIPTARSKCKRKEGDSEEEEDEDDDSEDQGDDDEEEEEDSGGKKGKKAEICEEEVSNSMIFVFIFNGFIN
uniref:Bromodomain adjacent to zinc finger domain 2B n=1 Tax=Seriola lalandi dorsalis TaxID=1841481 RepID=A0A3B4YE24_SERLL